MPDEAKTNQNDRIKEYLNVNKTEYINKEYQEANIKTAGIYTNYIDSQQTHQATV